MLARGSVTVANVGLSGRCPRRLVLVTAEAKKIFEQALALPERERVALIDALADSIVGDDQAEVDEAWRVEILRRVEQVRRGEAAARSLKPKCSLPSNEPSGSLEVERRSRGTPRT